MNAGTERASCALRFLVRALEWRRLGSPTILSSCLLQERLQLPPTWIKAGTGTRAAPLVQVLPALGAEPPASFMAQGLYRQGQEDILPDESRDINLCPFEEAYIQFFRTQFMVLFNTGPEGAAISNLETLRNRQAKELETSTAMELEVRRDLPPHRDPGRGPTEMQRGLNWPEWMNPFPRGIKKILGLTELNFQTP